ncbi:MAG: alpha/beta-hydrolase family protein [Actinomycetes bacterium]
MTSEAEAVSRPDPFARAGILVGAAAIGASFQPNLLTRSSPDQALISGASAAVGYGSATVANALWNALARRLPGGDTPVSESVLMLAGLAAGRALAPHEHESNRRAAARLVANGAVIVGSSSLLARLSQRVSHDERAPVRIAVTATFAVGTALGTYLALAPRRSVVGALRPDGTIAEDSFREVRPAVALTTASAVGAGLMGFAYGESYFSRSMSKIGARVLGGSPDDHRTLGRVVTLAVSVLAARQAMATLSTKMAEAGDSIEAAHAIAPDLPEVTGSPASHIDWSKQSREGRRWLSMVLRQPNIAAVMGEDAKQPIRVYAALSVVDSDEARADLLLAELDRTHAFERSVLALFSPTGSGYVNYVACETLEYLTRGDCASACIEYSVLPSSMSLMAVPLGARQTRLVVDKIVQRLLQMPADARPKFVLFGESLGSQVSQAMFTGQGVDGPDAIGLQAAVWIGTPSASTWRKQLWGDRTISESPQVGPGDAYLPRCIRDWDELPDDDRDRVRYLLLQNGDDPIPKFGERLLWCRPDWLGPSDSRPPGSPIGTRWVPFVTFFQTFVDMINALAPTPGEFVEGGHDYRVAIPDALRIVWKLPASTQQIARVQKALRERELGWEIARMWSDAEETSDPKKRAAAEQKAEQKAADWTGADEPLTPEAITGIIDEDSQPT